MNFFIIHCSVNLANYMKFTLNFIHVLIIISWENSKILNGTRRKEEINCCLGNSFDGAYIYVLFGKDFLRIYFVKSIFFFKYEFKNKKKF